MRYIVVRGLKEYYDPSVGSNAPNYYVVDTQSGSRVILCDCGDDSANASRIANLLNADEA